ncbi:uncharacterized protein A4U43_C03F15620 [Asparagus officinalis]|uniref:EF-hand domain-containing protein n=1 Tax=Asparagus officinalis TaxID=4686 RepID=A0A5P1FFI5_ASPOF|nr:neo-calmodulin-like [Asparagus officinalis]ONK75320.1 uncharacterized protein A4U43_C03F15620 [Asparagus officinalis]
MDFFKAFLPLKYRNNSIKKPKKASSTPLIVPRSSSPERAILGISDLKRVFDKFDTDGDGKITSQELESALRRLGQSPTSDEELEIIMNEMDVDKDGLIDSNEFLNYYPATLDLATVAVELEQAFSVFDLDSDGLISAEELQMTLINFGEEATMKQCQRMIEAFDCDGDGCISFFEFRIMMCSSKF